MEISENHSRRGSLISLTPLIDVVFILLVFFMLASSFVEWKFIELGLGESDALEINLDTQSLITVDFDEHYLLNGEKKSLDSIIAHVKENLRNQTDHPVLIKPADDLPLQQLVVVLDAISEVTGPNLSIIKNEP